MSNLLLPEDVWFTTFWGRLIYDVLKTSDLRRLETSNLRRLEDVWFTMSIYDYDLRCEKFLRTPILKNWLKIIQ